MNATAEDRRVSLDNYALYKEASRLREILRGLKVEGFLDKSATLGGDPESSFEQAFGSLAFTYIKDKAPRLLDFMVGFQLVDRNEDNTKAMGIFGFKIGDQWIYSPVFFLNGDLKGHEMMYLKGQDLFVPQKENWVNHVLNAKPHILGEATPRSSQQLGVGTPDIRSLSMPPNFGKYSAHQPRFSPWAKLALPYLGKWATERVSQRYPDLLDRLHLPDLLSESLSLTKAAMVACQSYPEIERLCHEFYGQDFLKQALLKLRDKAVIEERPNILRDIAGAPTKQAAGPPVEIKTDVDRLITENLTDLTESERERLLRDGILVRDRRTGDEVSKAYNVQLPADLVNPDGSGIYDVLTRPGEFQELLIINEAHTSRGRCDFATVVRADGQKNWLNCHKTRIWARPDKRTREQQYEWLDNRSSSSLSAGGTYVVVCRSPMGTLEGSAPFTVDESLGDGCYKVWWHDIADRNRPPYLNNTDRNRYQGSDLYGAGNFDRDQDYHGNGDIVCLNDRKGSRFRSFQGQLMVPPEAKVIAIEDPESDPSDQSMPCCSPRSKSDPIDPVSLSDIQMELVQKTAEMKLWADGLEVSINGGPLQSKIAGLISLVRDYGFTEKTARHMLRESEAAHRQRKPAYFRAKYAFGYPALGGGASAPAIPEQQYGFDQAYGGGVQTVNPQMDVLSPQELSASMTDPSVYDNSPAAMPDPMAMQAAQQAGQMGQKEVFDASMLSGLLRAVRQDSLVDRYMGDLMKALDRLGRILFQFYWHNQDFSDRYGKADMPELEDTLRNSFEVVGDLVLFLKEKDVNAVPGLDLTAPTVDQSGE